MTYTERMIEKQPAIGSIIARSETHIYDMTGMEVKLLLEEPKNDDGTMPLWGWMNSEQQNRHLYTVKKSDLDRLLNMVAKQWLVLPSHILLPKRKREIVCMKQIIALLVREKYPTLSLLDIGRFLNRPDHSTVCSWIKQGRKFLYMNDPYFMTYYSPVKFLFDADNV